MGGADLCPDRLPVSCHRIPGNKTDQSCSVGTKLEVRKLQTKVSSLIGRFQAVPHLFQDDFLILCILNMTLIYYDRILNTHCPGVLK